MNYNNYLIFDNPGIIYKKVMYIDSNTFLADKIFENEGLDIKRLYVYEKVTYDGYIIIVSKIRKTDINKFISCMEKLQKDNLIIGNTDYIKVCDQMMKEVLNK